MQGLTLNRIGRAALDLLYPPRCLVCGAHGTFLCKSCMAAMPRADGRRCTRCWLPLRSRRCFACADGAWSLNRLRSLWRYEGDVKRTVHAFKFGGHTALTPVLSAVLADTCRDHALEADMIVPVPLTASRRRGRGYNQALLLATEVGKLTGKPVVEALARTGNAQAQATSTSAEERRRNVEGAFAMAKPQPAAGSRVLLLDDVATTGATLNACATVLLQAGATSVSALTLARED